MTRFYIHTPGSPGDLLFRWRLAWQARIYRVLRAVRYASGRLSADDAQTIVCDCEPVAGWFPLLTLTADATLDQALEEYAEHPELRRLVREACSYVGHRWESYGDELQEARSWAMEKVREYAALEHIELHPAAIVVDDDPVGRETAKEA